MKKRWQKLQFFKFPRKRFYGHFEIFKNYEAIDENYDFSFGRPL